MNPGDVFEGRYEIIRELGSGGYATVWLAEHTQIGQKVAIKITKEPGADPRFLREAKILARLNNAHTVRISDFGETADGYAYMISEYIDGQSLEEVRRHGPLPAGEVERIVAQVLESLAEAHTEGIVHRDIKPANLMWLPDGTIKVLDFGIARVAQRVDDEGLTSAGMVLGTPRYLAPETLLGSENALPSTDIYSLGLVALELLTGEQANSGMSSQEIVARALNNEPFDLPQEMVVPANLRRWIRHATAKMANERYRDAAEALGALRNGAPPADQTLREGEQTAVESPASVARPAAQPTLREEGGLAFGAAARQAQPERQPRNLMSDGEGLREIELDLGSEALPEVARVDRRRRSNEELEQFVPPPRGALPKQQAPWTGIIVLALLLIAGGVAAAWHFGYIDFEEERPHLGSSPDDPQHLVDSYKHGRVAFDEGRWEEALMHFQNVEKMPDSHSARDLSRQDYVGRIIAEVLENAVDARESAETDEQMKQAAQGPRKLLEFYPEHEATLHVLSTIEHRLGNVPIAPVESARPARKSKKRKAPPKKTERRRIKIEGVN